MNKQESPLRTYDIQIIKSGSKEERKKCGTSTVFRTSIRDP